jgi:CubicO group peptidase (beta-lactamase class C family)
MLLSLTLWLTAVCVAFCRLKIQKAGKLVYDETFSGPLGTVTEDTIFRYYSQTKILTTAVVMLAAERGLLRLDDPVEMYIPEFADMTVYVGGSVEDDTVETVLAATPPTVRQCVMHTAGFGYGGLSAPLLEDEVDRIYAANNLSIMKLIAGSAGKRYGTLEKLAAKIGTVPLRHQPGTQWDYALGHIVAGRCVEVAMGRTLTEIMQTEVFDPLGMATAAWGVKANDPTLLPEFGYGTVEQIPGKPWTLKQRDPVASPPMPGLEAQMGTLLLPDVQMCGRADDWWKVHFPSRFLSAWCCRVRYYANPSLDCIDIVMRQLFACLSSSGRALTGYQLLAPRSVELMMTSQLPGGALLPDIGARAY